MSLTYVPLPFVKDDPKVQQRSMLTILGRGHRNPTCSRLSRSPDCPNCLVNCVDQAPWQASACPTKLTKEIDIPGPNCISFWGLSNYNIPWFISVLGIPIEPRTDKDPWSRKASQPLDDMAQKDDATITPFANRGRLPMVPMFTNTLLIFCISIPCGWLLQKPLYFIRINPLLLTFTNILWTILIYYLIDSLCCGWFLQTPCWYFVLSIPWSWFLQTPHGSLYILIGSTPVVDFYKHPVGILCYQSPEVDLCKHPMGHFIYY